MMAANLPQKGYNNPQNRLIAGTRPHPAQLSESGQKGDKVIGGESDFDSLADTVVVVRGQQ